MHLDSALKIIKQKVRHGPTRDLLAKTLKDHHAKTPKTLLSRSILQLQRHITNKKNLIFFCHYPLPNIVRQSIILRESGQFNTILIGYAIREEFRLNNFFDLVIECPSYWTMAQLMACLDRDLPYSLASQTYLQCVCGPAIIPALAGIFAKLPFILELYDTILVYWNNLEEHCDYHLEGLAVHKASGIIHKYPSSGHRLIQEHYNFQRPCLQFYAYPLQEFTVPELPLPPQGQERPRLVFAGGVMPPSAAKFHGHTNHLMHDLIRQVCSAGLELTIYANQNAKDMRWHRQAEYFLMQKQYPGFTLKAGLPFWRIPWAMRKSHFSLFYDNIREQRYNELHFKELMPTKFFTFLEAGLPILIYPQMSHVHQIVQTHGLGISYDNFQPASIAQKITEHNYQEIACNISCFREKISARKHLPHLLHFHDRVHRGQDQDSRLDSCFPLENLSSQS